jgi:aryl-alcohol dehydrogenase-like predicted oxidoreductase
MKNKQIGSLDVSVVGLGCNNFGMRIDADATRAVVDAAIEAGIDYFDTAEMYGGGLSEQYLGMALAGRRESVHIATKWGATPPGVERPGRRDEVRTAVEGSLARLGTDYIDHYQLHRPDPDTPVEETLGALAELVTEGKIREIGCSNFDASMLGDAAAAATTIGVAPFASVQNRYSLLTRDPETNGVLDACRRTGVAFVPYFPLESGVLTGKYSAAQSFPEGTRLAAMGDRSAQFIDDERLKVVTAVAEWASSSGHTVLDAAMSWLADNDTVATVIAGATKPEQVRANAAAASWAMTAVERAELEALLAG